MFHYHGNPVTPQEAADLISVRRGWTRLKFRRQRERDERDGTILRQLWAMLRGRDV